MKSLIYAFILFSHAFFASAFYTHPAEPDTTNIEQSDYRSACEKGIAITNGAVMFDGTFCRCTKTPGEISPFGANAFDKCKRFALLEEDCRKVGPGIGRLLTNNMREFRAQCLCVPTSQFLYELGHISRDGERIAAATEACRAAHNRILSRTLEEKDRLLHHYTNGLPSGVTPLVDLSCSQSVETFLNPANEGRTVKVVGKMRGKHGGEILVYRKKIGANWYHIEDPIGQQLDPRASYVALGPIVGPFFGFDKIDENTYTMPTIVEFNNAVDKVNANEVIVSGRAIAVMGQFGNTDYLKHFEDEGAFPASDFLPNGDQAYAFHDMALHQSANVVFPTLLFKRVQRITNRLREANEHAVEGLPMSPEMKHEMKDIVHEALVEHIDTISAAPLIVRAGSLLGTTTEDYFGVPALATLLSKNSNWYGFPSGSVHPIWKTQIVLGVEQAFSSMEQPELQEIHEVLRAAHANMNVTTPEQQVRFLFAGHIAKLENRVLELNEQCRSN